ncbi:LamB/YcsF family protein [Planococcus faecalis]|uniref:5-oxoprolinase subunit A n=1 Tax=Planococcus faecalis TaxID=1598147 RepID=A0ABM6IPB2_9BACL|nr:5-oxoprolinase subunit PxpA [Planococcus faecalis]AQU78023.1 lactam utilization protein LamB [Planococcus faecalis]OHX52220.1 lactam utilization protein LamB [Planococcus faecalis]
MTFKVDLNCDMGESFGAYQMGNDEEILDYVTSANIACGFHAGDPSTMRKTVKLALEKNVGMGAHPGLQDLVGFGRRNMALSPQEAYDLVVYQIGALSGFVKAEGGQLQHVKAHGALYNMAVKNASLSEAIAEAVYKIDPELVLFGLSGSEIIKAGEKIGLRTANEVFSDRTYQIDGSLTPRTESNALITDPQIAINQVVRMVKENKVATVEQTDVALEAETICIHGDGINALAFALQISKSLKESDIHIVKIGDFV